MRAWMTCLVVAAIALAVAALLAWLACGPRDRPELDEYSDYEIGDE